MTKQMLKSLIATSAGMNGPFRSWRSSVLMPPLCSPRLRGESKTRQIFFSKIRRATRCRQMHPGASACSPLQRVLRTTSEPKNRVYNSRMLKIEKFKVSQRSANSVPSVAQLFRVYSRDSRADSQCSMTNTNQQPNNTNMKAIRFMKPPTERKTNEKYKYYNSIADPPDRRRPD